MPTIAPPASATADREQLRELLAGCQLVALTTAATDGLLRSRRVSLLEMDAEARLWFFVSAGSEWVAGLEPAKRLTAAKGVANVAVFASTTTDWEFRPMPSAGIFERFTRLDDSRSRETGGSGLGLAIVRQIIESHDGSIGIEPGAGGARFVVLLPLCRDGGFRERSEAGR